MKIQNYSFHTHTDFSDGNEPLDNMLKKAVELGWQEIGITDHLTINQSLKNSLVFFDVSCAYYSFKEAKPIFQKYIEDSRNCAKKYPLDVKIGFEVDYFLDNGWKEELIDFLKDMDTDYLISGNHYAFYNDRPFPVQMLAKCAPLESHESIIKNHLRAINEAISSRLFNMIAHIDFFRRNKGILLDDYKPEIEEILNSLAKTNTATEISTKGLRKAGDFYPSEPILRGIKDRNIPIIISDDAHRTEELGKDFDKAEACLNELGITNRWHP